MTRFAHYQQYAGWYEKGFVAAFLLLNAVVLASARIHDEQRNHGELSFQPWEPYVWEISSVLVILLLIPVIHRLYDSPLNNWAHPKKTILMHGCASLLFSAVHVSGMVALREVAYRVAGMNYDFGNVLVEFFYEYRKDIMTYTLILVILGMHRALASRWQGEANMLNDGEDSEQISDRILVKKLGKEFIVQIEDIEWLESSGNYVNLYVGNRIYPTRTTLSKLMERLNERGFCRIHRSYGVNLRAVDSIAPQLSGNSEVTLKNGKVISLSRRYREDLKQRLSL